MKQFAIILFSILSIQLNCQSLQSNFCNGENAVIWPELKDSSESRFYAIGSWHGHISAFQSFFENFKHLYFQENLRVIFIEHSFSEGIMINNYIRTGETNEYLKLFLIKDDYKYLYDPLKSFYASLSDSDKFFVIGVDRSFHYGFPDVLYAIKSFIPANKIPDNKIQKIISDVVLYSDILSDFHHKSQSILDEFYKCFNENEIIFRDYFSSDFGTIQKILEQYELSKQIPDVNYGNCDSLSYNSRESFIYNNLKNGIFQYPNVSYIGFFGWAHVFLDRTKRFDTFQIKKGDNYEYYSFIARLNNENCSPVKGNIYAMQIHESNILFRKAIKTIVGKQIFRTVMRKSKKYDKYLFNFSCDSTYFNIAKTKFQYLLFVR